MYYYHYHLEMMSRKHLVMLRQGIVDTYSSVVKVV